MKKLYLLIVILIIFLGCQRTVTEELSEDQIVELLGKVVAGEEAVQKAGLQFLSEFSSERNNLISPADLQKKITEREDIYILDIRREADYKTGYIEDSKNIWWFDVASRINELPRNKIIIIACYTGQAAGQVVASLRIMGYNAYSLTGGMNNGWKQSNLPLTGEGL